MKKYYILAAVLIYIGLGVAYSYYTADKTEYESDFYVFYHAGHKFWHQEPIYEYAENDVRPYIYPPTAAMFFGPLSWVSLWNAVFIVSLWNFTLSVLSGFLVYKILRFYLPGENLKWPIVFGSVMSFRFFINCINMIQVNISLFVISLLAILFFTRKKMLQSGLMVALAGVVKMTPFIVAFPLMTSKSWKLVITIILVTLALFGLTEWIRDVPFFHDYINYYTSFLEPNSKSLDIGLINQSLSPALMRWRENVFPGLLSQDMMMILIRIITWAIMGTFLYQLLMKVKYKITIGLHDLALMFLTWHLFSPMTWKAHLVSLLFVFSVVYVLLMRCENKILRNVTFALIGLIGLTGKEMIGKSLFDMSNTYGVVPILLVYVFCYMTYENFKLIKAGREA